MARRAKKVPVKKKRTTKRKSKAKKSIAKTGEVMTPLATLREEVDNLFERFQKIGPVYQDFLGEIGRIPSPSLSMALNFQDSKLLRV